MGILPACARAPDGTTAARATAVRSRAKARGRTRGRTRRGSMTSSLGARPATPIADLARSCPPGIAASGLGNVVIWGEAHKRSFGGRRRGAAARTPTVWGDQEFARATGRPASATRSRARRSGGLATPHPVARSGRGFLPRPPSGPESRRGKPYRWACAGRPAARTGSALPERTGVAGGRRGGAPVRCTLHTADPASRRSPTGPRPATARKPMDTYIPQPLIAQRPR